MLAEKIRELPYASCPSRSEISPDKLVAYSQGYCEGASDAAALAAEQDAEVAELRREVERLREALGKIANPIAALRKEAKSQGARLDGMMACRLAESANYLSGIARKAISA